MSFIIFGVHLGALTTAIWVSNTPKPANKRNHLSYLVAQKMYKSRLQEYCQSKAWELPEYVTSKEGLDHCPQFKATVTVNGSTFSTPDFCSSSKEAQNLAAKLAFNQLTDSMRHPSSTSPVMPTSYEVQQPKANETLRPASLSGVNLVNRDDKKPKDIAHLYKNQLQTYAQKRNLVLPVYVSEREGPPHACRFKSKVTLEGKTYESLEFYSTIKDSENAAAKVALTSLSSDGIEEEDPSFYKNLLQELAQKEYSCLPAYNTTRSGASHMPKFISTVEINEESFTGQEARTKKLAELHAAKVAYLAMKERKQKQSSEPRPSGSLVKDTTHFSPSKSQSTEVDELPHKTNPETNLGPTEISLEQARSNKGAYKKARESKREPDVSSDSDRSICRRELPNSSSAPVWSPSSSGISNDTESLAGRDASSSSQKKVLVYRQTPDLTFPPGTTIMHSDENWVAVTMDSSIDSP